MSLTFSPKCRQRSANNPKTVVLTTHQNSKPSKTRTALTKINRSCRNHHQSVPVDPRNGKTFLFNILGDTYNFFFSTNFNFQDRRSVSDPLQTARKVVLTFDPKLEPKVEPKIEVEPRASPQQPRRCSRRRSLPRVVANPVAKLVQKEPRTASR